MSKSDQVQLWRCHILVKFPCWENWPICFIYFFETRAFNAQCFSEASSFKRSRAIMQIKGRPETQHVKQHTNFVWEYKWWYWKQFKWSSLKQYIWIFHNHSINRKKKTIYLYFSITIQLIEYSKPSSSPPPPATLRVPPQSWKGKELSEIRQICYAVPDFLWGEWRGVTSLHMFSCGNRNGWWSSLQVYNLMKVTPSGGQQWN